MNRWPLNLALGLAMFTCTCFLPAEERAVLDRKVGRAEASGMRIEVEQGLAGVRAFDGERLELWAQAPALRILIRLDADAERPLELEVHNCMQAAALSVDGGPSLAPEPIAGRSAACRFSVSVRKDSILELFSTTETSDQTFVFAVLSDVQNAINRVQDIFERMNQDPELAFVVSTGDLVNTGTRDELTRFQDELAHLEIPFFSTVGNHEMGAPPEVWHSLFGPFNVHFKFSGVAFSLIDSGNATIDPETYERLDDYLAQSRKLPHVVLTHVPPLDPAGLRGGAFRSRKEAAKFLKKLADGKVDALFLGHIHSYYAFSNAGIPSYISGGGGAIEERLDGIQRHYLRVRAHPQRGIEDVGLVRVD